MQQQIDFQIEFPEALSFLLFEPAPIKVMYGGRGAGKTNNIAGALVILSLQKKLRIACFRELQTSIDESVKQEIEAKIIDLGLEDKFEIQDKKITSITGSEFIFYGLRYNINKIKSLSRIDIAWVDEAVNVSKTSWDKLEPTIRGLSKEDVNFKTKGFGGPFGKGPEIWISFNPELDTDETYKRYVLKRDLYAPDYWVNPDTGLEERYAIVKKVNWNDNKWFPPDLKRKMEILRAANLNDWLNVWEGHTKQTIDGAIFAEEIKEVLTSVPPRRGKVPYDPNRPVHTFWDLGHSDFTAITFVQQVGMEYNIINYHQDRFKRLPVYVEFMQSLGYGFGQHYLPHDADHETLASISIAAQMRKFYPKSVRIVPRTPRKVIGINAARTIFPLCNFDENNTSELWQCLCRYAYKVDEDGKFSKEPDHNEWSHGADSFLTFAQSLKSEPDSKKSDKNKHEKIVLPFRSSSAVGWMGN
jgi:phage terminase large subunit